MPTRRITIVQQNDSHGYLWSHPELFWTVPSPSFKQGIGGFAKTAHIVQELRKRENVLFVDGGDVFHGTGPVVLSQGAIVPPLLKAMDIDVMVPGNWDFAYGPEKLLQLILESDVPALALNVRDSHGNGFLPPSMVMDLGDVRLGLIGLTYSEESQSMPQKFSQGLTFDLDIPQVSQAVSHLRENEKAEIVIVLSHMGLPADLQLARDVPNIDIILSAHSHDRLHRLMKVNGTLVMQSGANGSFLGILSFTVNAQGRLDDIAHQLLTLENVDEDKNIVDLLQQLLEPYQESMAEPIGQLGTPLHRMTVLDAPMDDVITDAYLAYSEADVAFSHGWRYGAPIIPGVFTQGDLYGMLPTNPELFSTELDGATLHDFLEKNLENVFASNPFHQKGGYVVRSAGLIMAFRSYNPKGHRIEYLAVNNQEVKMRKIYRVVSAGPQGLKGIDVPRHSLNIQAHDVVRDYFKRHKPVTVSNSQRVIAL
ncbi:bifunctional metallophosphatase/5'-nucleotidase [Sulfobacillus thermosulfidooxidans]|uniref:bifunctional metallophosphatase/5'-nucleotidase n=1 Tax=Sulfobacillus thermosulfidooxidans TaxID=28034 RepID=UPI0006B458D3|nr:bifunctional metallophosphatase/5'-nucleotidase [Sulfobacillus thermosulfidooxidans]